MEITLRGFTNLGNTCYFNAAVQALLSMHKLNCELFACINRDPTTIKKANNILVEYLHIFVSLVEPTETNVLNIASLYKNFVTFSPTIHLNTQEDAHEALIGLLNELIDKKNEQILSNIFETNLVGKRKSTITCQTCKKIENVTETFIDLSVPLPSQPKITIMDCINTYFTKELLKDDNSWLCPNCKKLVPALMETTSIEPAQIFIVTLKRFTKVSPNVTHKNSANVEIFGTLRINNIMYKLIATINHNGSTSGGHYYACVSRNTKWFTANDITITPCSATALSQPSVYIAIYQRT